MIIQLLDAAPILVTWLTVDSVLLHVALIDTTGAFSSATFECNGIVTAVSSHVSEFTIGSKVNTFGASFYGNKARCQEQICYTLPYSMTLTRGASIPVALMTAYHYLATLSDIEADQNIIIATASSSIGQAATLVARSQGATVCALV